MTWDADISYARSGELHIAYSTMGKGPVDLIAVSPGIGFLDAQVPAVDSTFVRLAQFARVIQYNQRGGGLSDPVPKVELPTMDERIDDIRVVLDACGSERTALLGLGHGGPTAMFFAATYPERVSSLVLLGTYARWQRAEDYPPGMPSSASAGFKEVTLGMWGTGGSIVGFIPSLAEDPTSRKQWARLERMGASPGQLIKMLDMWLDTDVRDILPAVRCPTLVLHQSGDAQFRVDHGRYLAANIAGAKYVELPGRDHIPQGEDLAQFAGEVEQFITGRRSEAAADRVLATVMFTDIVGSTAKATAVGDRAWRDLLDRHDETVRQQLERYRGHIVKHTGDGVAATFDGPARAITCAGAIRGSVRLLGLEVRAGLHTGEIERRGDDVSGVGVHIAARVAQLAQPGEVLVSSTVKDLVVGSGIAFEDRGMHQLKGVPDEWRLLSVVG
ncbi:MAG: adenylate/guanylate cyclase domain-containing protein [Candidatus Dormiibacterota bacterium]